LKSGIRVLNTNRNKRENITRIFEMHACERKVLDRAGAGDIVAVIGLKETLTGDTICDPKDPVRLASITFPQTVINMSIEPPTAAEKARLADALAVLRREDPTFECKVDSETGQTIISGMGELHLEIIEYKIRNERKVEIETGPPIVVYHETVVGESPEIEGKSPNKHNRFKVIVKPLEESVLKAFKEGEVDEKAVREVDDPDVVDALVCQGDLVAGGHDSRRSGRDHSSMRQRAMPMW
jgi:translation elongation factor EF-G